MGHWALAAMLALGQVPPDSTAPSPPTSVTPPAQLDAVRSRAWVPAVVGGALLVGGGLAIAVGQAQYASGMALDPDIRQGRLDQAAYKTVGGVALVGLGVCALGLSAFMWKWETFSQVRFTLALDGKGSFFALSGTLP